MTLKSDSIVERYFQEIEDCKGLPSETERDLSSRIRDGDEEALKELVKANLRFVITVAKQYQNLGLPLSDLINIGNVGLIIAARRFDGTRGFKFISYAVWWIRQSILQALAEQSRTVRLPLSRIEELTRLNRVLTELEQKLGRTPKLGEIADELEVQPGEINVLLDLMQHPISLEAPCDEERPDRCIGDLIPDDSRPAVDEVVSHDELRAEIERAMRVLDEWETQVLCMYYGLDGNKPITLEAIGIRMGRTRERIRQIKDRALQKLRHPSRSETLREFVAD